MNQKTKRLFSLLLLLLCLPLSGLAGEEETEKPLYIGVSSCSAAIREEMDKESRSLGVVPKGREFELYYTTPSWGYISYNGKKGYIRRPCIESASPVDPVSTPPYGVEVHHFAADIQKDVPVTSQPGGGDTLVTLHPGARVALIGFENGYGKLIFKRQYGYLDSNCLGNLQPVNLSPENAKEGDLLAAFVSFYKLTTNELNIGRIKNLQVGCDKLCAMTFQTGDELDFNAQIGPYNAKNGYFHAPVLIKGETRPGYGGGTCQVSSTMYNVILQLPGLTVTYRRAHGPSGAAYLPHGMDAAVGSKIQNFRFRNDYSFPVYFDAHVQDGALYMAIHKGK